MRRARAAPAAALALALGLAGCAAEERTVRTDGALIDPQDLELCLEEAGLEVASTLTDEDAAPRTTALGAAMAELIGYPRYVVTVENGPEIGLFPAPDRAAEVLGAVQAEAGAPVGQVDNALVVPEGGPEAVATCLSESHTLDAEGNRLP